MKELFAKRKQDFRQQCLKYLRYVFNDHFVLFLLIFMGFLGVAAFSDQSPTHYYYSSYSIALYPAFWTDCDLSGKAGCSFSLGQRSRSQGFYQGSDSAFLSLVRSLTDWNLTVTGSAFSGSGIACLGLRALLSPYASLEMVFVSG